MDKQKVKESAKNIVRQTKMATGLINELLDLTKIEAGKLFFTNSKFEIDELIEETVSAQRVLTDSHTIKLKGKSNKKVFADRMRIQLVLANLISNAVKYSPDAKEVIVEVSNTDGEVVVSVQDFGAGITKTDQLRVFEPFYRAKSTQSTKGAGIGLYLASQIVQKLGGRITLQSKVGHGSVFSLHLPTNR